MPNILRPDKLEDIIGQEHVVEYLTIATNAANISNTTLPHLLLDGPPGLGKTTLAMAIANSINANIQVANGANLRSLKVMIPFLMKVSEGSILFIDEIHRLTSVVEEFLYPAMEDFHVTLGKENDVIDMPLPRFTLIGATTDTGQLSTPFIDRFVYKCHLERYNIDDIILLIQKNATKLDISLSDSCCAIIAKCSRGTPRVANNILTWVQNYVLAEHASLTPETIYKAMSYIGIDKDGLDSNDRKYLSALKKNGVMGLKTISCTSNLSQETIETVIEPYLLEKGLIRKTSRGRVLV